MSRDPKLRKKTTKGQTYWHTRTGGVDTHFGNVKEVAHENARRAFTAHVASLRESGTSHKRHVLTAGELLDLYLDWLDKNRRTHLTRFAGFRPRGPTSPHCRADEGSRPPEDGLRLLQRHPLPDV